MSSFYPSTIGSAGSLSVSSGGTAVTGSGTSFVNQVQPGDTLYSGSTFIGIVASVASNTSLALRVASPSTLSSVTTWHFVRTGAAWNNTRLTNTVIAEFLARFAAGIGITPGATGTLAQRAAYDGAAQGFTYLRTDVTPFELYAKTSATSGAWSSATTLQGASGPQGAPGSTGATGNTGATGAGWVTANGVPSSGVGANGDYGLNAATGVIYQKSAGTWTSTGWSIKGPQGDPGATGPAGDDGADGADGADGKTILYSAGNPTSGLGNNGDFHINTLTYVLRGPKAAGAWPSKGVSLLQHPPVSTINASTSSVTLDMSIARVFIINLSANVTSVTITNWPADAYARCLIEVRNTGSFSFSHPSGVLWANGYAPSNTLGSGKRDRFIYDSLDGGSSRTGSLVGNDIRTP